MASSLGLLQVEYVTLNTINYVVSSKQYIGYLASYQYCYNIFIMSFSGRFQTEFFHEIWKGLSPTHSIYMKNFTLESLYEIWFVSYSIRKY